MRRVTVASSIGLFTEFYDNGIYGFLAATLASVFFPAENPSIALIASFAAFAVTFAFRPIGGVILGLMSDRIGRRPVMVLALILMTAATTAIGLLPGYATWGIVAPALLLIARVVQGISAGGEVSTAMSFVGEYSEPARRGYRMAWAQAGTTLALLSGSALSFAMTELLGPEAMAAWGWRIPFLVAAPLGIIGFYIRARLEETPAFVELEDTGNISLHPLRDTFSRGNLRSLLLAAAIPLLNSAGFYVLFIYTPTFLVNEVHLERPTSLAISACMLICATIGIPIAGHLSDRVGRRPVLIWSAILLALIAYPCYALFSSGSVVLAAVGGGILGLVFAGNAGVIHPALFEMFPTHMRNTSYSLGYNFTTAVFGGAGPLIVTALIARTGDIHIPIYFMIITAIGTAIATLATRETSARSAR